jgi:hypothetical protein
MRIGYITWNSIYAQKNKSISKVTEGIINAKPSGVRNNFGGWGEKKGCTNNGTYSRNPMEFYLVPKKILRKFD